MGYLWFSLRLWFRERPEIVAWWIAQHLPRRIAYLAFIRVWTAGHDGAPGIDIARICKNWEGAHVD